MCVLGLGYNLLFFIDKVGRIRVTACGCYVGHVER